MDPRVEMQRTYGGFSRKIRRGVTELQCHERSPFHASMSGDIRSADLLTELPARTAPSPFMQKNIGTGLGHSMKRAWSFPGACLGISCMSVTRMSGEAWRALLRE